MDETKYRVVQEFCEDSVADWQRFAMPILNLTDPDPTYYFDTDPDSDRYQNFSFPLHQGETVGSRHQRELVLFLRYFFHFLLKDKEGFFSSPAVEAVNK